MALAIPVQDSTPRAAEGSFDIPQTSIPAATTTYFDLDLEGRGWLCGTVWLAIPVAASLNTAKRMVSVIKIGTVETSAHAASDTKRYISISVHSWTRLEMRSFPAREAGRLGDAEWGCSGGQIRPESCRLYDDGKKIRLGIRNTHGTIAFDFMAYVDWIVRK